MIHVMILELFIQICFWKATYCLYANRRSTLLGRDDVENVPYIQETFKLGSEEEAEELAQFFKFLVPSTSLHAEYEE